MEQQESAALARVLASLGQPFRLVFWPPVRVLALAHSSIFLGLVRCFVRPGWESLGLR